MLYHNSNVVPADLGAGTLTAVQDAIATAKAAFDLTAPATFTNAGGDTENLELFGVTVDYGMLFSFLEVMTRNTKKEILVTGDDIDYAVGVGHLTPTELTRVFTFAHRVFADGPLRKQLDAYFKGKKIASLLEKVYADLQGARTPHHRARPRTRRAVFFNVLFSPLIPEQGGTSAWTSSQRSWTRTAGSRRSSGTSCRRGSATETPPPSRSTTNAACACRAAPASHTL